MNKIELAKQVAIASYLLNIGAKISDTTRKQNVAAIWRGEKCPSVTITPSCNLWYDHGTGEGGSIIDLVMIVEGCTFAEAVDRLTSGRHTFAVRVPEEMKPAGSKIKIRDVKRDVYSYPLKNYINDRGISLGTCQRFFANEVHFSIGESTQVYYSIGFQIVGGGYVLRNKHAKQCTNQGYSHFGGKTTVAVFEGWFDALTFEEAHPNTRSIVVLNSVANAAKTLCVLEDYADVELWLDNDAAGNKATAFLLGKLGDKAVDMRWKYAGFNDLNDCYLGIKKEA